jgi:uncharacterized membrane-anchored protein
MIDINFRKLLRSLLLIAALVCHTSYAEERSDASSNDTQASTETEQTDSKQPPTEGTADQKTARQQKDKNRDGEIFRPSEEISEDFAVSFPVDI